jgi:hypothetical protein
MFPAGSSVSVICFDELLFSLKMHRCWVAYEHMAPQSYLKAELCLNTPACSTVTVDWLCLDCCRAGLTFCVSSVVHWHCFFSYSLYSDQTFSGSPLPYFWSAFSFSGIQLLSCDSPSVLQTWSFLFHISFLALFLMFLMNVSPFVKLGVVTGFFQASAQMPPEAYIAM